MSKKIYVGNLSYTTSDETLKTTFEGYGTILSATVIMDRVTGQSKGFGFVEFEDDGSAEKAIAGLNGRELDGRRIRVSVAEERPPRRERQFGDRPPRERSFGDRERREHRGFGRGENRAPRRDFAQNSNEY